MEVRTTAMRLTLALTLCTLAALPAAAQYGTSPSRTSGIYGANNTKEKGVLPSFPGTIKGLSEKSLSLETEGDNTMVFHLGRKTAFLDGDKKISPKSFQEGDLIVVEGRKSPDGSLEAVNIYKQKPTAKQPAGQ